MFIDGGVETSYLRDSGTACGLVVEIVVAPPNPGGKRT